MIKVGTIVQISDDCSYDPAEEMGTLADFTIKNPGKSFLITIPHDSLLVVFKIVPRGSSPFPAYAGEPIKEDIICVVSDAGVGGWFYDSELEVVLP